MITNKAKAHPPGDCTVEPAKYAILPPGNCSVPVMDTLQPYLQHPSIKIMTVDDILNEIYREAFEMTAKSRGHKIIGNRMFRQWTDDKRQCETFCGTISEHLVTILDERYKIKAKEVSGNYTGPGRQYSEDWSKWNQEDDPVGHTWIVLPDGTIIDGSAGQFRPRPVTDYASVLDRVDVIPPHDPRQQYYEKY